MTTQCVSPYDPELDLTVPPSFEGTSALEVLRRSAHESEALYHELKAVTPQIAAYGLLGAHRRRIIMGINGRELVHLARLRMDEHAQWDIRHISAAVMEEARKHMPLTLSMAVGKHDFNACYRRIYGCDPPTGN